MGSPTGDGAIEALQGKPKLRRFSSGKLVTDAGLRLLQNFPMLAKWHGRGDPTPERLRGRLLIDGPFTNDGLAGLVGLEGVFDLDLFWHVTGITSDGFAHLVGLPNLGSLGADGKLSDDAAMRHFAAMPRLSRLRIQETVATDDGFEALSRSKSIEFIWGRQCPNLGSRGFVALSKMPAVRGLGVGCKNVDDAALSTLPQFPALRELTPIDVQDDGFVHVGRCQRLERLTCMYCRETTDVATEHIAGLGDQVLLRGADEDHRPEPGSARADGVTGAGRVVRVQRRNRRGAAVPRRPAPPPRGSPGLAARRHARRARRYSRRGSG